MQCEVIYFYFPTLKPSQKLVDLPGNCPFSEFPYNCPYGLTCRFSSSHEKNTEKGIKLEGMGRGHNDEVNGLDKEFQKKFWKNEIKTPRADSVLEGMDLLVSDDFQRIVPCLTLQR